MTKKKTKIESQEQILSGSKEIAKGVKEAIVKAVQGVIDVKTANAINNCAGKTIKISMLKLEDRKLGKYTPVFEELEKGLFEVFNGLQSGAIDAKTAGSINYCVDKTIRIQRQTPVNASSLETQLEDFRKRIVLVKKEIKNRRKTTSDGFKLTKEQLDGILRTAQKYVDAIDEDPANREKFQKELSGIVPVSTWNRLEAIGRKTLDPRLVFGMGGAHTTKIKRLPYSLQQEILSGKKFDYLTPDGSTLKIDLMTCTDGQAKQMFNGTKIRSILEQKSWIEAEKLEKPKER